MSVPEQLPLVSYIANGSTTSFAITFDLHDDKYLLVTKNKELMPVGSYSIQDGSVILGTAPITGDEITLARDTQLDRETNFKSYDNSFRPESINWDLDKLWHVLQEQNLIDVKVLNRLKEEIEWRRVHDFNYDELAQVREKQLFDALKGYADTLNAATNPNIFQGVIAGVVFAKDGKSIQAHIEDILNNLIEDRKDIDLKAGKIYVDDQLALKAPQASTYSKNEVDTALSQKAPQANTYTKPETDSLVSSVAAGHKGYQTLALAQAAQSLIPINTVVEVTNDPTTANNGTYQWNGATLTKSIYDPLTQAKNDATDKANKAEVNVKKYADDQKVQKYTALNRQGILYEVTDARGSPTWIQVADTDGMPTEFSKSAIRGSAGISDSKLIILKDGALLFCVPDSNGNPTAISARQSDGMFPDFVIENIASRLNVVPDQDMGLIDLQYKPKPTDFQILSSIARGVARHVVNAPLPSVITDYVNSTAQPVRLTFPTTYSDATPLILVICFEGIGDFEDLTMRPAYADLKNHGVLWARCRFHENHYGNQKSMRDAREIYQKACEISPIGGVVVVGNSMGGVAALNALTTEAVPNILGVYLTDPVCDLRQRYDNGRSGDINAAYDCTAATYLEKTKGYDPLLQHWSKFKGVPISIVATSNDSLVPMSAHTNKLVEKLSRHNDIKVIDTKAGWHNHPDEFIVSNLISFINQCATGTVITNI